MANRYGQAAIVAARDSSVGTSPARRWRSAMEKVYTTSSLARKKGSPREAFLGLCEEGLVKDIPPWNCATSKDDKAYCGASCGIADRRNADLVDKPVMAGCPG